MAWGLLLRPLELVVMANIEGGRSTAEHSMGTMWSPCTFAFVLCSKEGVAVGTGAGREALDRVDAILRKLAEDKVRRKIRYVRCAIREITPTALILG